MKTLFLKKTIIAVILLCNILSFQSVASTVVQSENPTAFSSSVQLEAAEEENDKFDETTKKMLALVNEERLNAGISPLTLDEHAMQAAEIRVKELETSFSHTRPNGTSCFSVLKEVDADYRYAGENVAYGFKTPEAVMDGWMNSGSHRDNIMNSRYTRVGLTCYVAEDGTKYWGQFFLN